MSDNWLLDVEERVLTPYYHAIGLTTVRWAKAEEHLRELTGLCSEIHNEVACGAIFTHMPNIALTDALSILANESFEPDLEQYREHLLHACRMYNICRENRNLVAHLSISPVGYEGREVAKSALLFKTTARGKTKHKLQYIDLHDIRNIADEIEQLNIFILKLIETYHEHRPLYGAAAPAPLPNKPPLPDKRNQSLESPPPLAQRLPPTSPE